MPDSERPFFFVTVGTDHHPFDRLIEWVDSWLASQPVEIECFVQSGTSPPPRRAQSETFLSPGEVLAAFKRATAVVSHGGPGSIVSCRTQGTVPIVVPRRRRWGEAVDDHQVEFSRRLAARGEIVLAQTRADLWAVLDRAVSEPTLVRLPPQPRSLEEVTRRFAGLVESLVAAGETRRRGQHAARSRRPDPT
jgi:UDP-N-acetylglucosamine transferase subunit ALG13